MSSKFKIGDHVRVTEKYVYAKEGMTGVIIDFNCLGTPAIKFDHKFPHGHTCHGNCEDGYGHYVPDDRLELIMFQKIVITTDGEKTLARLYNDNKVVKSASATCSPDDTFDFATGAKIAFDRLTSGVKEVNRPAKEGDYIKIVNAMLASGHYCNGDIFKVNEVRDDGSVFFKIPGVKTQWKDGLGFAYYDEYVVLEGYVPEEHKDEPKYYNGKVVCIERVDGYAYTVGKIYEFKDGLVIIDSGADVPMIPIKTLEDWNKEYPHHLKAKFIEIKE